MLAELTTAWWRVCSRPSTDTFRQAASGTSHVKTFAGVLVAAILGVGLSWVAHWFLGDAQAEFMGLASVWVKSGTPAPVANWVLLVPLGVVYGFYTFQIVLFLFARILGGKGPFGTQSYVQSLFYGPLALVQQVVVVTPSVGRLLFALVAVGSLLPTTTSLKAVHGYSTLRAVWTWVLPVILNIVVVIGVIVIVSRAHR
jgi:hypothetical protein